MAKFKFIDGGLRFCLFLEYENGDAIVFSDEQMDALFKIDGVEVVGSEGCQTSKVVFRVRSMDDFTPERLEKAKQDVLHALEINHA